MAGTRAHGACTAALTRGRLSPCPHCSIYREADAQVERPWKGSPLDTPSRENVVLGAAGLAAGSVHVGTMQRGLDSCSDFPVISQSCRGRQKGITEQKRGKQGRADRITQGQGYRPVCGVASAHLVLQSGRGL